MTETIPLLKPIPFWVNAYSLPDLFAGKVCAVLTRNWKKRVKGRDWYDLIWFIQNSTPIHRQHLEARLRNIGFYQNPNPYPGKNTRFAKQPHREFGYQSCQTGYFAVYQRLCPTRWLV